MKLKIAIVQGPIVWEDRNANLRYFEKQIKEIGRSADIILLPEMFDSGFTMNVAQVSQHTDGPALQWMKLWSKKSEALILGSVIVQDREQYFNRLLWVEPGGHFFHYDKRHLFRMGDEHKTYTQGDEKLIRVWKGWRICPLICYDLRFPVWSRNRLMSDTGELEYDLLIYLANWPAPRVSVWDTLLKARALENQSFVVGVNRIGTDGEGISYNGHSQLIDYKGSVIINSGEEVSTRIVEIDKQTLLDFRQKFPAYLDGDSFEIQNRSQKSEARSQSL